MRTNYCVISINKLPLLEMYVQLFESHTTLRAIVEGIYIPSSALAENTETCMLGRIKKYLSVFDKVYELSGFVLVADDNQLSEEIIALMQENGVQIMSNQEYLEYYKVLCGE